MIDKLLDDGRLYGRNVDVPALVHWLRENGALWLMGWRNWGGLLWEEIWSEDANRA